MKFFTENLSAEMDADEFQTKTLMALSLTKLLLCEFIRLIFLKGFRYIYKKHVMFVLSTTTNLSDIYTKYSICTLHLYLSHFLNHNWQLNFMTSIIFKSKWLSTQALEARFHSLFLSFDKKTLYTYLNVKPGLAKPITGIFWPKNNLCMCILICT